MIRESLRARRSPTRLATRSGRDPSPARSHRTRRWLSAPAPICAASVPASPRNRATCAIIRTPPIAAPTEVTRHRWPVAAPAMRRRRARLRNRIRTPSVEVRKAPPATAWSARRPMPCPNRKAERRRTYAHSQKKIRPPRVKAAPALLWRCKPAFPKECHRARDPALPVPRRNPLPRVRRRGRGLWPP